jgi:hypothetical protein
MTLVVLFVLFNPEADGGRVAQQADITIDVTIDAKINSATAAVASRA